MNTIQRCSQGQCQTLQICLPLLQNGSIHAVPALVAHTLPPLENSGQCYIFLSPFLIGNVQGITLPGSHITPCGTDLRWNVGAAGFSPQDAVTMALKQQSQVRGGGACVCTAAADHGDLPLYLLSLYWLMMNYMCEYEFYQLNYSLSKPHVHWDSL